MSATTSPPPPPADNHPDRLAAFDPQTPFDPFQPSLTNEDPLDHYADKLEPASPYQNPEYSREDPSTNPLHGYKPHPYDDSHSQGLSAGDANSPALHDTLPSLGGLSPQSTLTPLSHNGLSPSNAYSSDYEYAALNEYVPQDFTDSFLLEANFGPLPVPDDGNDISSYEDSVLTFGANPINATTSNPPGSGLVSRKSTGIATLSSHLMSPVLTDSRSLGSESGGTSPISKPRLLGGGAMSRLSSQSTATGAAHGYGRANYAQPTPAMAASSVEASPRLPTTQGFDQHTSPVVRIESYSRGDSPARSVTALNRSNSKRSRASRSSFLAAPNDNSSEEDEDEDRFHRGSQKKQDTTRIGVSPSLKPGIAGESVPNFQDQEDTAELETRNAEVKKWLSGSEIGDSKHPTETGYPIGARKYKSIGGRRRAKSTSDQRELEIDTLGDGNNRYTYRSSHLPGPGVLVREDGEEDEDDEDEDEDAATYAEGAPASVDSRDERGEAEPSQPFQSGEEDGLKPADAYPWIDPIYFPSAPGTVGQPATANAAIMRYAMRARDVETASRAATWGTTGRRLSEGDLERVFGRDGFLSRLSISKDFKDSKDKNDGRGSFLQQMEQAAAKFLSKRSNSTSKRKGCDSSKQPYSQDAGRKDSLQDKKENMQAKLPSIHERKESLGSRGGGQSLSASLRRMPSVGKGGGKRPRSPKLNTGGAVASLATQIATLGGNGSISPTVAQSPTGTWNALKRTARGEFHRTSSTEAAESSLAAQWSTQSRVSPAPPTFTSPPDEKGSAPPFGPSHDDYEDAEVDDNSDEKGVTMDFTPSTENIIPTFEGFKINVHKVNPRLPSFLVERLGQEQLRRYKKLVEFKVKHAQAKRDGNCLSGEHCVDNGGVRTYFPSKASQKEPTLSHTGFTTARASDTDEDAEAMADGVVTAAQFPPGVPMPPVKRLPAQFECPLCFSVKKFQKPSDWSKHVHEDLQPFTCTFRTCPDPKSFKRKADWVRHENERHRKLEWWTCTEDGCQHQCYRRDNFVQHLVREHKMPEPKAKTTKPNKPAVRGPAKIKGRVNKDAEDFIAPEDQVLHMVETCRHETAKNPMNEPCRFCGNVCNTWKKLTVHLARHMEQISMPILELARQKDVTGDTIISPIEQKLPYHQPSLSPAHHTFFNQSETGMLPYEVQMNGVKQELPGAFTPLQNAPGYPPHFDNRNEPVYTWGQPSAQGPLQSQPPTVSYPAAPRETTYMRHNRNYSDNGSNFEPVNPQARYIQPPAGEAMYNNHMTGQIPHLTQSSYVGDPTYTPHFSTPQYVNSELASVSQQHSPALQASAMQYDTNTGMPFSQSPNDPTNYQQQQPPPPQQGQYYQY